MQPNPSASSDALDLYVIDLENLHHVQRGILVQLYTVDQAVYSDLKPPELTGNAFNHHLRHIVSQQLIRATSDGHYMLTPKGRLLVDNVSLPSMKLKLRPVAGAAVVLTSARHGTLLYRSNREPTRGLAGLPFGRLRLNESLETTVGRIITKRQLDPRAVTNLKPLGHANIRYFDHSELVSHRLASVWTGDYAGQLGPDETSHGRGFWSHHPKSEPHLLEEVGILTNWPAGEAAVDIAAELPR